MQLSRSSVPNEGRCMPFLNIFSTLVSIRMVFSKSDLSIFDFVM